jgi:hypothetical protein
VELRGFEPLASCMPSQRSRQTGQCRTPPASTSAHVSQRAAFGPVLVGGAPSWPVSGESLGRPANDPADYRLTWLPATWTVSMAPSRRSLRSSPARRPVLEVDQPSVQTTLWLRSSPTPKGRCCDAPEAARRGAGDVAILTDPGGSVLLDRPAGPRRAGRRLRSSPTPEGRCCRCPPPRGHTKHGNTRDQQVRLPL